MDAPIEDTPLPLVYEIESPPDTLTCWRKLRSLPGCLLLESSMRQPESLARYSFLMADPFQSISVEVNESNPLAEIRSVLQRFAQPSRPGLPPFQGGVAGVFAYDLNQSFESISPARFNDLPVPAIVVGIYDVVITWDHHQNRAWVISQGFPETESERRTRRAEIRLNEFLERLAKEPAPVAAPSPDPAPLTVPTCSVGRNGMALSSNFSADQYRQAVQTCIDYIVAGDAFQINLAQQLLMPATSSAERLYENMRERNPSTFGGFFDASALIGRELKVISASPERFFSVRNRVVETRPIKGTRPRTGQPTVDLYERDQLSASEKDAAENVMIVDLMRNDLSRVCEDDSIEVSQLCELEAYQNVLHLVSAVEGTLKEEHDLVDLLASVFPGGSITGAPKVRAMEIIAELESAQRGFYCGSMGYLGFSGDADLSILIRTITQTAGWWQIPVGGGIVSQSNPDSEYKETWTKATGMLNAIRASTE